MEYQKIYNQIIKRAQNRQLIGYKEKHHIIPKCMGGDDSLDNIVELTAREHFLCHRLLCEIYPTETKLWYSLWLMVIGKNRKDSLMPYKLSSRSYEKLRLDFVKRIKGIKKPSNKGRKVTWGAKISESLKGKKKPQNFNKNNPKLKGRVTSNKPILQYDALGNFIKEWTSAKEVEYQTGLSSSTISANLRGKTKTSGGYIWKYKE